jgi:CoA:oxalate CoA-transferase
MTDDDAARPPAAGPPPDAGLGTRASLLGEVKIVDLTGFLAGPFAGMILADLGASVIKVEPLTGDATRRSPPHFHQGDSAYFLSINRNKRSLAMDIKSPQGREILRRLVATSDVILDNLRAEQRIALGLGFDDLQRINPQIVSCSITGFGSDGPYRNRPAYDIIVEAMGGIMSLTGPLGGPSVRAGVPIGDITASLYAAIGTLAGLEARRAQGKGVHIDVAMLDCQISLLSYLAQYYLVGGVVPSHQGREHMSIPVYNTFGCGDGREVVVAANTEAMWQSLCRVLHREDLIGDERYLNPASRLSHRDELVAALRAETAKWTADDFYQALVAAGVPAAPINSIDVTLRDPQVVHRQMVVQVPHHGGGEYLSLASPIKVDGAAGEHFTSPPGLGADTEDVLGDLGYSSDEIAGFLTAGAVRSTHPDRQTQGAS